MKLTILAFLLLICTFFASSQPWFIKHPDLGTSYDYIYDILPASDDGYVFTGSAGDSYDFFLTTKLIIGKINDEGDTLWIKRYGELTDRNVGFAITTTSDGGYLVAGTKANKSAWLLRFNSFGDTLWTKELAVGELRDVIVTKDGKIAVAGIEKSNQGNVQALLMITDSIGNLLYGNTFGSIYYEEILALAELPGGNLIISGSTNGMGAGDFDAYLAKLNNKAVAIWDTTYGSLAADRIYDMILDSNNNIVLAGSTNRNSDFEHLIIKTDTLGNIEWENTYSSSASNAIYDIQESGRGGYIAIGVFYESEGWYGLRPVMLRIDTAGSELWLREYNSAGFPETFAYTGIETSNNDIFLIGSGYNATFIRTDGQGTLTNVKNLSDTFPFNIFPNPSNGNIFLRTKPGDYSFRLYNMQGQQIHCWDETVTETTSLNLSNLKGAQYILNMMNEKKSKSVRIIIR